jgi:hypothetical protein
MVSDQEHQPFLSDLNDDELDENIRRKKNTLNIVGRHLPDQGAKLRDIIGRYEEEVHRRKLNRPPKVLLLPYFNLLNFFFLKFI